MSVDDPRDGDGTAPLPKAADVRRAPDFGLTQRHTPERGSRPFGVTLSGVEAVVSLCIVVRLLMGKRLKGARASGPRPSAPVGRGGSIPLSDTTAPSQLRRDATVVIGTTRCGT